MLFVLSAASVCVCAHTQVTMKVGTCGLAYLQLFFSSWLVFSNKKLHSEVVLLYTEEKRYTFLFLSLFFSLSLLAFSSASNNCSALRVASCV